MSTYRAGSSNRYVTTAPEGQDVHYIYVLELLGPPTEYEHGYIQARIHPSVLREAEENLTDLLPEGYSARIREWDAKEETPHE